MDVRSSFDGLRSLLGVSQSERSSTPAVKNSPTPTDGSLGLDQATLSSAGSQVSLAVADDGVRADKVAVIQAALAAGTYNVPASAVASSIIDSMLAAGK